MVMMARNVSAAGIAVLRFDHRGLGDSDGTFNGFEHNGADIQAAIDCLRREVPEVSSVVLWGGCDAASACMIHAPALEGVASMVLGNPWVTTAEIQEAVLQQHYLTRLRQWSFWRKLLRFEYNLLDYAGAGLQRISGKLSSFFRSSDTSDKGVDAKGSSGNSGGADVDADWLLRMQIGLRSFKGPVMFLMSGQSLISKEFDELMARDKNWASLYGRSNCRRVDLPDADQTFSSDKSRAEVSDILQSWVMELA
jgi:exosortase A-associated hydrolase 1